VVVATLSLCLGGNGAASLDLAQPTAPVTELIMIISAIKMLIVFTFILRFNRKIWLLLKDSAMHGLQSKEMHEQR
jgi:hypothetical protein